MGVDADAVRELGASDFETAVVAIGTAVEAGILATYVLVDLKIPRMWAKAITGSYGAILERVAPTAWSSPSATWASASRTP